MHAPCSCLWLFVHLCMLSASTCLTITTLQHRRFDPTYTSLHPSPFFLLHLRSINQIPCSTSACVIPPPLRGNVTDLHRFMRCFLTHPHPEKSIEGSQGVGETCYKLCAIFHFLKLFFPSGGLSWKVEGMTILNISCFLLGNSVRLERDLVFHRNMSNWGSDCGNPGSSMFLSIFCFSALK